MTQATQELNITRKVTIKFTPRTLGCSTFNFDCIIDYYCTNENKEPHKSDWDISFQTNQPIIDLYNAVSELGSFEILELGTILDESVVEYD